MIRNAFGTRHARATRTARPLSVVDGKNINRRRALVHVISKLKISRPVEVTHTIAALLWK